ncbi:MAG: hypothetical protein NWE92_06675 [Candidatus Bathyarchaeota archaeon]|nr:hypothetical protein [Candidatus Bathyarchaeota archaeon]
MFNSASFSIPADFKVSTIDRLDQKNKDWPIPVREVYGSIKTSVFGSGRDMVSLPDISEKQFREYIKACQKSGIEFNYVFNFKCNSNDEFTTEGKNKIVNFASDMYSIGIRRFTVVLPSIIDILNTSLPKIKISVSVISNVDSLLRIRAFAAFRNVDRIMLPEYLNRRVGALRQLTSYSKKFNCSFGTIVNSLCLIDCPYRDFHYSFTSHAKANLEKRDFYDSICRAIRLCNVEELLKMPWIRPEDISRYIGYGIEWFKISGREKEDSDLLKMVDIYNKENYSGNLLELLVCFSSHDSRRRFQIDNKNLKPFINNFFDKEDFCLPKNCDSCRYCPTHANLVGKLFS